MIAKSNNMYSTSDGVVKYLMLIHKTNIAGMIPVKYMTPDHPPPLLTNDKPLTERIMIDMSHGSGFGWIACFFIIRI